MSSGMARLLYCGNNSIARFAASSSTMSWSSNRTRPTVGTSSMAKVPTLNGSTDSRS